MALLIVIDGLDGCGKATQTEKLKEYLESIGKKVYKVSFPNYESNSSSAVKMYLGGELGDSPAKLNPYICSSFYAVDRFIQFEKELKAYFEEDDNTIVICDRYLSANIIHQGGKIEDREKRHDFIEWVYEYETKLCGLPIDNMTIVLTVPPEVSQKLMSIRYNNDESKKDIHENSLEYLNSCYHKINDSIHFIRNFMNMNWNELDCSSNDGGIKSIEEVNKEVTKIVDKYLNTVYNK